MVRMAKMAMPRDNKDNARRDKPRLSDNSMVPVLAPLPARAIAL